MCLMYAKPHIICLLQINIEVVVMAKLNELYGSMAIKKIMEKDGT